MQTERRVAADPQTKPIDVGCETAVNWQLHCRIVNTYVTGNIEA